MNDAQVPVKYAQRNVLAYVVTKGHRADEDFITPESKKMTDGELINRFQAYPTPSWVFISPTGSVVHGNRNRKSTARDLPRDVEVALAKQ